MKIKTKLSVLAISMVFAILLSVGINIGFQRFIDKMLMEQNELIVLRDLMQQQNITLSKFLNNKIPVLIQIEELKIIIDKTNDSIEQVRGIDILPTLNEKTIKAFSSIGKLDDLLKVAHKRLFIAVDNLVANFDKSDTTFSIKGIALYKNRKNYTVLLLDTHKVVSFGYSVEIALEAAFDILTEQSSVIGNVVQSYKRFATIISLSVVGIAIVISMFFALLISGKISRSIAALTEGLSLMATGDFTKDIKINSSDELGILGDEMNRFQDDLNQSLNRIKNSSKENEDANIGLIETAADSSAVTTEISANIDSINNQMLKLDENIFKSNSETKDISEFAYELNNFTTEQMAMVEESTAAITEMIASISSISGLTDNNSKVIKTLEATVIEGDNKLNLTTDLIEDINSTVNEINSMSEIIQNISDQTNLLAMNAAIEAAHAGDAGKGFAVVADEIRKLAEASAENSRDISKNLSDITTKFEQASVSGQSTREAFTNINNNIKNVSHALLQVSSSTTELNTGGSQILEAMEHLKEISISVQDKSQDMKNKVQNVATLSSDVSNISQSVSEAISEANIGFAGVTNSIVGLKDLSDKVGIVSKAINDEVEKFKTT